MLTNRTSDQERPIANWEECVLSAVLDRQAQVIGDRIFAIFDEDSSWTYAQLREQAVGTAAALRELGVQAGDHVAVCLQNGPTILRVWLGINYLGAVFVPINTALLGNGLQHAINSSDSRLLIIHSDYVENLVGLDLVDLETVIVCGDRPDIDIEATIMSEKLIAPIPTDLRAADPLPKPWDTQCILYTSGTSGPAKGVVSTHALLHEIQHGLDRFFDEDDRILLFYPIFHIGGMAFVAMILQMGASMVLPSRFRTQSFWEIVHKFNVTAADLIYSMMSFLMRQPAQESDADNPLRLVGVAPLNRDALDFAERFKVDIFSAFDMTELPPVLSTGLNPEVIGTCGTVQPGFEVRLVDDSDIEVPIGEIGELIVRADRPWVIATSYYKNPIATADAWRNGWFHTGDAFRTDATGNFFFIGRINDVIRRRGENISAQDIEDEVLTHPDVLECAAVGVPSEFGEEEVLLVVVLKPKAALQPADLVDYLGSRLASFMIPRFVRYTRELPKSTSFKIKKQVLKSEGVTPETWERIV